MKLDNINGVLSAYGVVKKKNDLPASLLSFGSSLEKDEFDSINLGKYRQNRDFFPEGD